MFGIADGKQLSALSVNCRRKQPIDQPSSAFD